MGTFRFKAFISYSHRDKKWGAWLQHALESYRVPKRLVGKSGEFGTIPQRLTPVFRDREDLSSASDLTVKVKESQEAAETLIVICSPASARSKWVNEEIRHFRSLGREDKIFALIIDGDPQSDDPDQQCFPSELTINADGTPCEPLAADARKWADGKRLAKLKIVAGILGIRLDDLRQRDMQRQRRNWTIASVSTVALLILTGTLVFTTLSSQKAARLQRTNTEDLLSYMLGNLKQLDPIVGLEVLGQENAQNAVYLETLGLDKLDNDRLAERGMDWREQGQEAFDRGLLDEAMEHFDRSRTAFVELHQREGGTRRALFELGQAEFWVGYVHFEQGDLDEAQECFTRYGAVTRRLIDADPNDAAMVMELAYSITNLGALELARNEPDTDKALQLMQSGVQYNQIALVLDPENDVYRKDLRGSLAFLADGWLNTCDLGKAFGFRQQAVDLSWELHQGSPESDLLMRELAFSLTGLANVQKRIPMSDQAVANLREAINLLNRVSEQSDDNPRLDWEIINRKIMNLQIRAWIEPPESLWPEMNTLRQEVEDFMATGTLDNFDTSVGYAELLLNYSQLAWRLGKQAEADQALNAATDLLLRQAREKPENRLAFRLLSSALLDYWERYGALPGEESAELLDAYLVDPKQVASCEDASLAARLEYMRGNIPLARYYTEYLFSKGFYEPEFVDFCKKSEVCSNIN